MPQIAHTLFKAYDIRGKEDLLTFDAAYLIGRALGSSAREAGFCQFAVGQDGRLSSPKLAQALTEGLIAAGIDTLDIGLAVTPMLYYAASSEAHGCGVMITGSHNPPEYNGVKIMFGHEVLSGEKLQALYQRIINDQFGKGLGTRTPLTGFSEKYLNAIVANVPLAPLSAPLTVVVDCGNGAPGAFAPNLYEQMGCHVIPLYCTVDGRFPNHHPDPQCEANLADLKDAVQTHTAQVGFALDGDGDRLGVITPGGNTVSGDKLLMLFAKDVLRQSPGALVLHDVKCSHLLEAWISQHHGHSELIQTGHSYMKRYIKEKKAVLAGEYSGHIVFGPWGIDDALYNSARMLQLLAAGMDLNRAYDELPKSWASPEIQIPVAENGHDIVRRIALQSQFPRATRRVEIDGIRVEYPQGFSLIRASNTMPVLTLRLEANDQNALEAIRDELRAAIAPLALPDFTAQYR